MATERDRSDIRLSGSIPADKGVEFTFQVQEPALRNLQVLMNTAEGSSSVLSGIVTSFTNFTRSQTGVGDGVGGGLVLVGAAVVTAGLVAVGTNCGDVGVGGGKLDVTTGWAPCVSCA